MVHIPTATTQEFIQLEEKKLYSSAATTRSSISSRSSDEITDLENDGALAGYSSTVNMISNITPLIISNKNLRSSQTNTSKRRVSFSTGEEEAVTVNAIEHIKAIPKAISRKDYLELREEDNDDHETEVWGSLSSLLDDGNNSRLRRSHQRTMSNHQNSERNLALEAMPPLLIAVAFSVMAGWLLDVIRHWRAFTHVTELFILIPILFNLKGNLEMNLASRMSTSANLGELDEPTTRDTLIWGNMSLLQVQALIIGTVAGLFSFIEGIVFDPHVNSYYESMMVIVSSMLCSASSSMIIGAYMCVLVVVCRRLRIDPDNIACPMASSIGDLLTLIILSVCGEFLLKYMNSILSTVLFIFMALCIPFWVRLVWTNECVKDLMTKGWSPLFWAMLISSLAGLVLEKYVERYSGLALLTPVLNGLSGNIGSIYSSRISTRLHSGTEENYWSSEITLFLTHIPIEAAFLIIVWWFDIGHIGLTWSFVIVYLFVSACCVICALILAKKLTIWLWNHQYDPDNYSMPYLTAVIDTVGTTLLVLTYLALTAFGLIKAEETIPTVD